MRTSALSRTLSTKPFRHAQRLRFPSSKIPILDNFTQIEREIDGKPYRDYKLSRLACYLTAMNGDVKKSQVAKAQAYFAAMAETVRQNLKTLRASNGY